MAEDFVWSLQGLNEHHFTAFGNLLALRNGGQVEPASLREELLSVEKSDNDSDSGSDDTNRPQPISQSGHNALKREFLDCLAEYAANKKGGAIGCMLGYEGSRGECDYMDYSKRRLLRSREGCL